MALSTILTDGVTGGTNSHATSVYALNMHATDFGTPGIVGTYTLNTGSGGTGSFCINADASPDMGVTSKAGQAYVKATPAGQTAQLLRATMSADTTAYTINANASGSTKYDWIYLSIDATKANNPAADSSDVTALFTSRSSSNTVDNGAPPTYGLLLAIVTVANGASSITNANISDQRVPAAWSATTNNAFLFDFVESGLVWSGDSYASTLNASMTSGFVWISGKRLSRAAVSARAFTASKDTYVDVSDNNDGTVSIAYTEVANNAASPALAAGAVRIGIIVSGATNIAAATSVNQGQETRVLPIASSVAYSVTDSLGNLICPRDPNRKLLGYEQAVASQGSITTEVDVTGCATPVNVPTARKIKIGCLVLPSTTVAGDDILLKIKEGATILQTCQMNIATAGHGGSLYGEILLTPTAGAHTYKITLTRSSGTGTVTNNASAAEPTFIKVELA